MSKVIVLISTLLFLIRPLAAQQGGLGWESLSDHNEAPEWFRDAKFGIYFHWGPYSVPAYGNEHYPRTMYGHPSGKRPVAPTKKDDGVGVGFQTFREHDFHIAKYGEPKNFEYHDLIPMFTASEYDAEEWAELFYKAGAKFAGPVAIHHDGYAMWDSDVTPWNVADTGPKRDVLSELSTSIRARGLKLITTFHHAKTGKSALGSSVSDQKRWHYYGREKYLERELPEQVGNDSEQHQKLYGTMPWEEFTSMWNNMLEEVIDGYEPDIIWFDSWLDRIPQENRIEFVSYYLDAAKKLDKEVVITYKQNDLPQSVGVVDFEKGRMDELTEYSWLTDGTISDGTWTTTGSWSYTEELDIKSSKTLLHILIDIVSKNGNFLLNISPMANGVIPETQKESLLGIGKWLDKNGEAIYGTRPFGVYGEGPKRLEGSGHFVRMNNDYNEENLRFTTKGSTIYAIQMGWAGSEKEILIKSLSKDNLNLTQITNVSVVDSMEKVSWEVTPNGLVVTTPFKAPNKTAVCFKIETTGWYSMNFSNIKSSTNPSKN